MVLSVSVFSSRAHLHEKTPLVRFLSLSLSLPLFDFGASQDKRSPYALLEVITNNGRSGRVRTGSRSENTRPAAMEIFGVRCHGDDWKNEDTVTRLPNGDGRAWKTQHTLSTSVRERTKNVSRE